MDNQEQNNILPEAEAPEQAYTASTETPSAQAPVEMSGDAATENVEVPAEEPQPHEGKSLPFDFGAAEPPVKRAGSFKLFVGLFAAVLGLCVLLLAVTLWMGDAGFKIIREVETERIVYVREYTGEGGLLTPQEVTDLGRKSTVTVSVIYNNGSYSGNSIGSGFVYSAEGYIVTNHHVISGALSDVNATVQVVFSDATAVDAAIVGYDEAGDLAVLRVAPSEKLIPVTMGSSADLLVGDSVVAIGTPANLDYAGTATFGAVSATERLITMTDAEGNITHKMKLFQTDAGLNPGNSGGPLFDMYGRVVGIAVMKVTSYGGTVFDGIGFAIPMDGAKVVVDAIIKDGHFKGEHPIAEGRSLLGVTGHGGMAGLWYSDASGTGNTITPSEEEKPGYHYMPVSGVYVMAINGGDALDKLRVGDIITRVDGLFVQDVNALIAAVNRKQAYTPITLTVYRGGTEIEVTLTLTEEVKS